ncbi:hypothetical protein EDD29_3903 [Actinocorallia herbida]|uniref:Aminoglycoside-2''-adenylyltransferase n=1 Tax=Actinocorallia herbida TaxID=58109 RepID=A0A3N1CYJ0_9ACTN|nr:amino acid transporter [Actinocorallia herbida]ROO86339.1 hypothetical protein EDD29_3903 [Actinocorallia herbida]
MGEDAVFDVRGPWAPLTPGEAAELLRGAGFPWWIAGGHAIELAVGEAFRAHADLDVLVLHRDHAELRRRLGGWEAGLADPPGTLRAWPEGGQVPEGVHDVWCRRAPGEPWAVQFMLDGADGADWVSRRDPRIRMPLAHLGRVTGDGIPYLRPEVQLYYKAKAVREKDALDFARVSPLLDAEARTWLSAALALSSPGHPWRDGLSRCT